MVKKTVLFTVLVIVLASIVVAEVPSIITDLRVIGESSERVLIQIYDADTNKELSYYNTTIPSSGVLDLKYASKDRLLAFNISFNNEGKELKKYVGSYPAGRMIIMNLSSLSETPITEEIEANTVNQTQENVTEEVEEELIIDSKIMEETESKKEDSKTISGFSISNLLGGNSTKVIYYAGGILAIALIFGFVVGTKRKGRTKTEHEMHNNQESSAASEKQVRVQKYSEWLKQKEEEKSRSNTERVQEAERKIREAQALINRLKQDSNSVDNQSRIREEQEKLNRLRGY